jgi:hypothetical protein
MLIIFLGTSMRAVAANATPSLASCSCGYLNTGLKIVYRNILPIATPNSISEYER